MEKQASADRTWTVPSNPDRVRAVSYYRHLAAYNGLRCRNVIDGCTPRVAYFWARQAAHYANLVLGYRDTAGMLFMAFDVRKAVDAVDPVAGASSK